MVQIILKPDNIKFHDERQNLKLFQCSTGKELLEHVVNYYKIDPLKFKNNYEIQIWSAPMGVTNKYRLDKVKQFILKTHHQCIDGWIRIARKPYDDDDSSSDK
jgi:hypothetical protein